MIETTQEQTTTAEASAPATHDGHPSRALAFARRHPALTVIGVAGAGLIGGLELAAGVVIGAGIAALVRGRRGAEPSAHAERERASRMMEQMAPEVKKRALAVIQAARGKLEPTATPSASH